MISACAAKYIDLAFCYTDHQYLISEIFFKSRGLAKADELAFVCSTVFTRPQLTTTIVLVQTAETERNDNVWGNIQG